LINKKGQTLGLAIVSSILCLIIGMMLLNFLMPEITDFRINAQCSNAAGIHDGVKLLCLVSDAAVPYFIVVVFSLVIGGITARLSL